MLKYIPVFYLLTCWLSLPINAQEDPPKLGLVLGGGGAKGLAHIGVLKVLEEYGIYPDVVTGTSMGSIVGGLYSIGYSPTQLENLTSGLDWNDYFNDSYPRIYLPVEERQRADRYQLSLAIENGAPKLPRGLIRGRKIQTLLDQLTIPVHQQLDFDQFYYPFRAVATNLETGEGVVFSEGPLAQAIRASLAIPSVFEPIEVDGNLLVDGLLVRNLPVEDALDLDADIVIAVDVGTPLYEREDLNSIIRVLEQSSSFGSAISTEEQRALADYLILPDLEPYTTLSYDAADSLIYRGEAAARAAIPELLVMLDSLGLSPPLVQKERPQIQLDSFWVIEVKFMSEDPAIEDVMARLFSSRLPRLMTSGKISEAIGRLYGSGFFDYIQYSLTPLDQEKNSYQLSIKATGSQKWRIAASLNFDSDFGAGLLLNTTGRNVLGRGSLWLTDVRISENPGLFMNYQIYTRSRPSIGIRWRNNIDFYLGRLYNEFRPVSQFQFHEFLSEISLFSGLGKSTFFELGIAGKRLSQNQRFFNFSDGEAVLNQYHGFAQIKRETFDRISFPSKGGRLRLYAQYIWGGSLRERTESERKFSLKNNQLYSADFVKVIPFGKRFAMEVFGAGATLNYRERNLINLFFLGRAVPNQLHFNEFYGLRYMEQPASSYGYLGLKIRQEISRNSFVALGFNYGRFEAETYSITSTDGDIFKESTESDIWGLGLELGSITPLGPIRFTAEYNPELGRMNFSLHGGYYF